MAACLAITFADGSTEKVRLLMADTLAFEREHKRGPETKSLNDVAWLMWHSSKRLNGTVLSFEEWSDTVGDWSLDEQVPLLPPPA